MYIHVLCTCTYIILVWSRCLLHVHVHVSLLHTFYNYVNCPRTLTFDLQKRLPSDRISGRITLTVKNHFLPPNPSTSSETTHTDVTRESNGTPANIPHLHPSALLRVSRLVSLSSEDSVSIGDVLAADLMVGPQEVGGATSTDDNRHEAVSSDERTGDDVIVVDESVGGGQSSDVGAAMHEQTSESTANTESAAAVGSGGEMPKGGANDAIITMEMTSSEPNEPPVASANSNNLAEGDESTAAANNSYSPHKKKKLSDTLDRIRTTLYGSGRRLPATGGKRRSHTVLSRHVSLRVPPSHDDSAHNLVRSQKLSGSISMFQLHTDMAAEMTESLPPSKL